MCDPLRQVNLVIIRGFKSVALLAFRPIISAIASGVLVGLAMRDHRIVTLVSLWATRFTQVESHLIVTRKPGS